jgi:uncharacterized protein YjiS (DUF1127 family)
MNRIHIQNDRLIVNNPTLNAKEKRTDRNCQKQQGWMATIHTWIIRSRHRQDLLKRPDYLLQDIGLTREEVVKECNSPFWKSGIF